MAREDLYQKLLELQTSPGLGDTANVAISKEAHKKALSFVNALPTECGTPKIKADENGDIVFTWGSSRLENLVIRFTETGEMKYSSLIGLNLQRGSEPFSGSIPIVLLDLIKKLNI